METTDHLRAPATTYDVIDRLTTQTVFSNSTLHLDRDEVRFSNHALGSYTTITEGAGKSVLIVPVTAFHHTPHIGLTRKYRYPVKDFSLELPRGAASGLSAEEAARELVESTGLTAARLELLGVIHPDTSLLTNEVAVWYTRTPRATNLPAPTGDGADLQWFSYGEVLGLQRHGHISCSMTLAALSLLNASGLLSTPY